MKLSAAFLFPLFLACGSVFAQRGTGNYESDDARAISVGYNSFNASVLNNYFAPHHQNTAFAANYLSFGTENFTKVQMIQSAISLQWILPMESSVGSNDSLHMKLGGWQMMTSLFGFDALKMDAIDLVIGPQITWGNYKLRYKLNSAGDKLYKDPFIAPGGRIDLRFNIGRFLIGARAVYCYDITDPKWKRKSEGLDPLPGYRNRGLYYAGYIGLKMK